METIIVRSVRIIGSLLQKAGPYLLLEILLPGGTILALALFLYQRNQQHAASGTPRGNFVTRAISMVGEELELAAPLRDIASAWRGRNRERDGLEALAIAPTM